MYYEIDDFVEKCCETYNYELIKPYVEKLGFKFLDSGADRMVFLNPNKRSVIKIQYTDSCANDQEIVLHEMVSINPKLKPYFAKILNVYSNRIIEVERLFPITKKTSICKFELDLNNLLKDQLGIFLDDLGYRNIMKRTPQQLVVADYSEWNIICSHATPVFLDDLYQEIATQNAHSNGISISQKR